MTLIPPVYVTARHYIHMKTYAITGVYFTLRGAKKGFRHIKPEAWDEVEPGCWQVSNADFTATIQRLGWEW